MTDGTNRFTRRRIMREGGIAAAAMLLGARTDAAPLNATERAQLDAVRTFADGWGENDPEKIVSPFSDNCAVRWSAQRVDLPPFLSKGEFLTNVKKVLGDQVIQMRVTDMVVLGPVVVNCHHQLFERRSDKRLQEDLYIGVYFFENGKIREWNDYAVFDPEARKPRPKEFDAFTRVAR